MEKSAGCTYRERFLPHRRHWPALPVAKEYNIGRRVYGWQYNWHDLRRRSGSRRSRAQVIGYNLSTRPIAINWHRRGKISLGLTALTALCSHLR